MNVDPCQPPLTGTVPILMSRAPRPIPPRYKPRPYQQEDHIMPNSVKKLAVNVAGTAVFAVVLVGLYSLTGRKWG